MDMSKHPGADAAHPQETTDPHHHDTTNPGEVWAFALAAALVGALGLGFALGGLTGVGLVMVALVPVIYLVLIIISVGR